MINSKRADFVVPWGLILTLATGLLAILLLSSFGFKGVNGIKGSVDEKLNLEKYLGNVDGEEDEPRRTSVEIERSLEEYYISFLQEMFSRQPTDTGVFYTADRIFAIPGTDNEQFEELADLEDLSDKYELVFITSENGVRVFAEDKKTEDRAFEASPFDYPFLAGKKLCVLPLTDDGYALHNIVTKHGGFTSEDTIDRDIASDLSANEVSVLRFDMVDNEFFYRIGNKGKSDLEESLLDTTTSFDYIFYAYENYVCFLPTKTWFGVSIDGVEVENSGFADTSLGEELFDNNLLVGVNS